MTKNEQDRLENLERMIIAMNAVLCKYVPEEILGELSGAFMASAESLGSDLSPLERSEKSLFHGQEG